MPLTRSLFRLLLGRRLPRTDTHLTVDYLRRPVDIRRDRYGIPYIRARTEFDAWYGLGFCQGQDRAFQLEILLRTIRGTLSEIVGPDTLPIDRLSRRIGFYRSARQQMEIISPKHRKRLTAFARGVTAGTRQGVNQKAHGFALLRSSPTPFTPADTLGILKLMSFLLPSNWAAELARIQILRQDGAAALKDLEPVYPEWLPTSIPSGTVPMQALDQLTEDLALFTATVGFSGGSNNWVVAADRTSHDRPVLACDPHLPPNLPSYWYLSHIRTNDWTATGASLAGTPGYPVGFNGTLAWGITAGLSDNTDLFFEKIDYENRQILDENRYVACTTRTETIRVKDKEPIEEEVFITPRGPVISPALPDEDRAVSIQATWLTPSPIGDFLDAHRAETAEELRYTFESWPFLPLNVLYADKSGDIGWQLIGDVPRRKKGWGNVPHAGWKRSSGWKSSGVNFRDMPHLENPDRGFLATANNPPGTPEKEPYLGIDWIDGYRLARINDQLGESEHWTVDDMLALQTDRYSLPWKQMRNTVLDIPRTTPRVARALQLLEEWDGQVSRESSAASVFELFVAAMCRRVVFARAPNSGQWALGQGFHPLVPHTVFGVRRVGHLVRLLQEQPDDWFDRTWEEEMADVLDTIVKELQTDYGDDPNQWSWGTLRPLILEHPLGERRLLAGLYNRGPFPYGGDSNTVAQASVLPNAPTEPPLFIPSLRMVVEVGNWENNRFVLPGGQSGNPLSPHYDDLLELWKRERGISIAWSPETVREQTTTHLRLTPNS